MILLENERIFLTLVFAESKLWNEQDKLNKELAFCKNLAKSENLQPLIKKAIRTGMGEYLSVEISSGWMAIFSRSAKPDLGPDP